MGQNKRQQIAKKKAKREGIVTPSETLATTYRLEPVPRKPKDDPRCLLSPLLKHINALNGRHRS